MWQDEQSRRRGIEEGSDRWASVDGRLVSDGWP
jgi:hypothetical protein